MSSRPTPTARQARLGAELRKLREAAGVPNRHAAAQLGVSPTQISHIESGRFGLSEERLRRMAEFYDCDDTALVDALVEMSLPRFGNWWDEYRNVMPPQALDLAELEHDASYVRAFEVVHIPGVLQTEEHVRAASVFFEPSLSEEIREARVSFRMRRQQVTASGTPYDVIIHEAALRMRVGGSKVARAQLEHLLLASEREAVTLRVIPFTAEGFAGAGLPMQYVGGAVPQLDTVQFDTTHGAEFIDAPARLSRYRALFESIDSAALPQDASLDLIRRIAQEL
ncbi:helix-turn-helix transcriptional regulator [Streptomyces sp. ID05-47C]|uniref:helix-turn-helix domain-containing protein n=1 Tax=Streptomyces sp. ID05-47C TaxID=3028665 RepID=UPI0029B73AC8|nr:helix-turn-helix transcriptional regulator [Streptomyces sp. ID05-47C]MDX3572190.1 helix-turn-helix transcriptional regulator [Streptomyces sp. ID05-47C]